MIDFRFGAQGEDVVSGTRSRPRRQNWQAVPEVCRELIDRTRIEEHFRDMQDIIDGTERPALYPPTQGRKAIPAWLTGLDQSLPGRAHRRRRGVETTRRDQSQYH